MHNAALSAHATISAHTTDADLAQRAASGDQSAFECIMRRHNRLLFRTARSILKNDSETEDALQEAYLHAWRALGSFRADAKLSTWLVRIVINESLGRLRRRGAQVIPLDTASARTVGTIEVDWGDAGSSMLIALSRTVLPRT